MALGQSYLPAKLQLDEKISGKTKCLALPLYSTMSIVAITE
jgi:hypothetical protein